MTDFADLPPMPSSNIYAIKARFYEGWQAALNFKSSAACPYPAGSDDDAGWSLAIFFGHSTLYEELTEKRAKA